MPTIVIAPALARWLAPAPDISVGEKSVAVAGTTVRELLDDLFKQYPVLRSYVTDERGAMRHHVVAFLNGAAITDKTHLSEAVLADGELYLFQALSGGSAMSNRLLVSTKKGLFALARGGAGWRVEGVSFLGENVTLAHVDHQGGWYAALHHGHFGPKLKFSPDRGTTWEERAVPAYPEGATISGGDGKPPVPATLKMFWAFESGVPEQNGRLWTGTLPGGLFRSDDGGRSWELVRGLWDRPERAKWFGGGAEVPGIHSVCRDPRDPKTVRIAVSCGGVWITKDDGATWENIGQGLFAEYMPPEGRFDPVVQDPHMMVQCRSNPDHLWIQHHNGVFRSTDGAKTFESVPNAAPSVFGFGVAVHPKEPKTAWFVPAVKDERRIPVDGKLVVSRTRDGGQTFEVLRNGLPQENCYDLVYRHALAIDDSGDRLAFGSTTGGLWTTDNQGDRWTEAPARLPPIHAVRFAA